MNRCGRAFPLQPAACVAVRLAPGPWRRATPLWWTLSKEHVELWSHLTRSQVMLDTITDLDKAHSVLSLERVERNRLVRADIAAERYGDPNFNAMCTRIGLGRSRSRALKSRAGQAARRRAQPQRAAAPLGLPRTAGLAMVRDCALLVFAVVLAAVPVRALTIEETLVEAARSNPNVQAARAAARSRHESVPLALSAWLPTVQLTASASGTRIGTAARRGAPTYTPLLVRDATGEPVRGGSEAVLFPVSGLETGSDGSDRQSLELAYTHNLFRSGRDTAGLRQAEESVRQSHAVVEDTEQTVLLRAATAYLDVLRAERTVRLREAALSSFQRQARETKAQFRVGDRTQADVAQADAEREIAAADMASAKAGLEVQQALFETLVGLPAVGLEPAGEPAGLPGTLDAALDAARSRHPAVRAAVYAERAATYAVRAAKGDIGPSVDLRATVARTVGHGTNGFLNSTDQSLGIQLRMPLYQAGSVGTRLRQARHALAQRRDQRAAAQREAAQRAASAWHGMLAARQRRAALATAVEAARVALAGIRRETAIGERSTREVLDAERSLVLYQVRALTAERDALVQAYSLLDATGALTPRELEIRDLPDLEREAERTRWNLRPGLMFLD